MRDDNKELIQLINRVLEESGAVLVNPEKGTASEVTRDGKTFPDVYRYLMKDRDKRIMIDEQMALNIIKIIEADSSASDSWIDLLTRQDSRGDSTLRDYLMARLPVTALLSTSEDISHLILVAKTIIKKCSSEDLSEKLIAGLTESHYQYENALHRLMSALSWAVDTKSEENISQIATLVETILSMFDADQLKTALFEHKYKDERAFDKLLSALSIAAEKTPSKVPEIKKVIETIFTKLKPDQLIDILIEATEKSPKHLPIIAKQMITVFSKLEPKQLAEALSKKITEGKLAGLNVLHQLMHALSSAAIKSPGQLPEIATLIKTVLEKLNADQLEPLLSAQITAGELAGENALHRLMGALHSTAQSLPVHIPCIVELIKIVFVKLTADQLVTALSSKIAANYLKDENALHRLMFALDGAVLRSSNHIPQIATLIATVFEKLDSAQLTEFLSAQITAGKHQGENALHRLMYALDKLDDEKIENAPLFKTFFNLLAKLKASHLSDENKKLILDRKENLKNELKFYLENSKNNPKLLAMCESDTMLGALIDHQTGFVNTEKTATRKAVDELLKKPKVHEQNENTPDQMINALFDAIEKSPKDVHAIAKQVIIAFSELDANQLIEALSAKIKSSRLSDVNALHGLVDALAWAAEKKSSKHISHITALIKTVFDRLSTEELAAVLSEQIKSGEFSGANALYLLMNRLALTAYKSSSDIPQITTLIKTVFDKLDTTDQLKDLLSVKITAGELAGDNVLHRLMNALAMAAEKSSNDIPQIAALIKTVFEKLSTKELKAALSAERTAGEFKGVNVVYRLMNAFAWASQKSLTQVPQIAELIKTVFEKLETEELVTALSAERESPEWKGLNALYYLMYALDRLDDKKIDSPLFALFFNFLAELNTKDLSKKDKELIFNYKDKLKKQLILYLENNRDNKQLSVMCGQNTMLGALIDHQAGFVKTEKTDTRKAVDELLKKPKVHEQKKHPAVDSQSINNENTPDQMFTAIFDAIKKSPKDISGIVEKITAFSKLDADQLAPLLSAKIKSGKLVGAANELYRLMGDTLAWASQASPVQVSVIIESIETIFDKLDTTDQLKDLLSVQITEGKFAGENVLHRLMNLLTWAADKSSGDIQQIAELIKRVFDKLDTPNQLKDLLSRQITAGELAGVNALNQLMSALAWASQKSPTQVTQIAELIKTVFERLKTKELVTALSAERMSGDWRGQNALYVLMYALDKLDDKKIDSPLFALFFNFLAELNTNDLSKKDKELIFNYKDKLKKQLILYLENNRDNKQLSVMCGQDTMLGALIDHQRNFVKGLVKISKTDTRKAVDAILEKQKAHERKKPSAVDSQSINNENTPDQMINAIFDAIEKSSKDVPGIVAQITAFSKLDANQLTPLLSAQIKSGVLEGANTLYRLMMVTLAWASQASPAQVSVIIESIETIFDKLDTTDQLAAALSTQITAGKFAGENVLHRLMSLLGWAAEKSSNDIPQIAALIKRVFDKLNTAKQLASLLLEQRTSGESAGVNALSQLMNALAWAAEKSPSEVSKITPLIKTVFERLTTEELVAALSAKIKSGEWEGENALHRLMNALSWAAEKKPPTQVQQIAELIKTVFDKLDANQLNDLLSAQIKSGNLKGENALHRLMYALDRLVDKKIINSPLFTTFFNLLAKLKASVLSKENKEFIFNRKNKLRDQLKSYLEKNKSNPRLLAMCESSTMLGALIDHQTGFVKTTKTATRKAVDELLEKEVELQRDPSEAGKWFAAVHSGSESETVTHTTKKPELPHEKEAEIPHENETEKEVAEIPHANETEKEVAEIPHENVTEKEEAEIPHANKTEKEVAEIPHENETEKKAAEIPHANKTKKEVAPVPHKVAPKDLPPTYEEAMQAKERRKLAELAEAAYHHVSQLGGLENARMQSRRYDRIFIINAVKKYLATTKTDFTQDEIDSLASKIIQTEKFQVMMDDSLYGGVIKTTNATTKNQQPSPAKSMHSLFPATKHVSTEPQAKPATITKPIEKENDWSVLRKHLMQAEINLIEELLGNKMHENTFKKYKTALSAAVEYNVRNGTYFDAGKNLSTLEPKLSKEKYTELQSICSKMSDLPTFSVPEHEIGDSKEEDRETPSEVRPDKPTLKN